MPDALVTHRLGRQALSLALLGALVYGLGSYLVAPQSWRLWEQHHAALSVLQSRSVTAAGIPGDPLNIAIVASEPALEHAMAVAGWHRADRVTAVSSARIVEDVLLHRAYEDAPVSALYVWGRRQDQAYEQAAGRDPSRRHHVRFWRSDEVDEHGRPLWVGAATFDSGVGLSHTTGQVTHHISPDVDQERNRLVAALAANAGAQVEWRDALQHALRGANGNGDPFFTDGRFAVLTLPEPNAGN